MFPEYNNGFLAQFFESVVIFGKPLPGFEPGTPSCPDCFALVNILAFARRGLRNLYSNQLSYRGKIAYTEFSFVLEKFRQTESCNLGFLVLSDCSFYRD